MAINIVNAPPASGKTTFCVQRILKIRNTHPLKDIWVLIPDGYHAIAFRKAIAESGGALGVRVVTFNNLLREILESTGNSLPTAPNILRQAFVRLAIMAVFNQGKLKHYVGIREMPGFITAIQERIAILKREMIFPEDLMEKVKDFPKSVQELASIYTEYQKIMIKCNWADPEGLSWLAIDYLEQHPEWNPNWPLLVLDGFDSFTKPQIKALERLSKRVPEIIITLPGSREMSRPVHQRFINTFETISQLKGASEVPLATSVQLPEVLAHVEAGLGNTGTTPISTQEKIQFVEARSPAEEAREALRWLKGRILGKGIGIQDCAIIVPEPATYNPHLKAVAEEFGLPIAFSVNERLSDTPFYKAIESLLFLPVRDYPRRLLLDLIRSPFFNLTSFELTATDASEINWVSQAHQIVGGRKIWLEILEAQSLRSEEADRREEQANRYVLTKKEAARLFKAIQALFDRITPPDQEQSLVEWVTWLEDLLAEIKCSQDLVIRTDVDVLGSFRQLLRDLVLTETATGVQVMSYQAFFKVLNEGARNTTVCSSTQGNYQRIQVLRTVEGRGVRHVAVAILGLSEGVFPRPQREDPFLTEEIRAKIGLDSAFDRYQLGLFYQAVTRANQQMLLTRPYLTPDGEPWEPSPFWELSTQLYTEESCKIVMDGQRSLSEACSPAEILAWASYQGRIHPDVKEKLSGRVNRILHGREVLKHRLVEAEPNPYNGRLTGEILKMDPEKMIWSASRLESYLSCPYQYFVTRALELKSDGIPELGMDVSQRGTIMHKILERVFREATDSTDLSLLLNMLENVAEEELDRAPQNFGFRPTSLWDQEKREIKNLMEETIRALHEISTGWIPWKFETPFGTEEAPALEVSLEENTIRLRGVIDRVDKDINGNVRIIDYKLGSSKMGRRDLEEGRRIQLPIYGLAARDALEMGEPMDGFYWQINQAKASSLTLRKFGFEAAVSAAKAHIQFAEEGITRLDFKPSSPKEGCPEYCPAAGWCWEYKQGASR